MAMTKIATWQLALPRSGWVTRLLEKDPSRGVNAGRIYRMIVFHQLLPGRNRPMQLRLSPRQAHELGMKLIAESKAALRENESTGIGWTDDSGRAPRVVPTHKCNTACLCRPENQRRVHQAKEA